jgi:hypothetical protein
MPIDFALSPVQLALRSTVHVRSWAEDGTPSDQQCDRSHAEQIREDELIDQAGQDSFPASDSPPFWARGCN